MHSSFYLGGKEIGRGKKPFIIAEIGSNHNGDKATAKRLINVAAEAGADAVKFQTFKAKDIASDIVPANAYGDFPFTKGKTHWHEVLAQLAMPYAWYEELFACAKSLGLLALSTPESLEAADFLNDLGVPAFKIASMDLTYVQLLEHVARFRKPVLFSTGMGTQNEIDIAVKVLETAGLAEFSILHCISHYPPRYDEIHLPVLEALQTRYACPIGFSDHAKDNLPSFCAVAKGAAVIEKHITLDSSHPGPDHRFALEPQELQNLVAGCHTVARMNTPQPAGFLDPQRLHYQRSIVAKKNLVAGETINWDTVECKRPGTGIPPYEYQSIAGKTVARPLKIGELVKREDLR